MDSVVIDLNSVATVSNLNSPNTIDLFWNAVNSFFVLVNTCFFDLISLVSQNWFWLPFFLFVVFIFGFLMNWIPVLNKLGIFKYFLSAIIIIITMPFWVNLISPLITGVKL